MDTMLELPGSPDTVSCLVTRGVIEKGEKPVIQRKPKQLPAAARKTAARAEPLRNDAS